MMHLLGAAALLAMKIALLKRKYVFRVTEGYGKQVRFGLQKDI